MLPQRLQTTGNLPRYVRVWCARLSQQAVSMVALGISAERLYREHRGDPLGVEWARAGVSAMRAVGISDKALATDAGKIDGV